MSRWSCDSELASQLVLCAPRPASLVPLSRPALSKTLLHEECQEVPSSMELAWAALREGLQQMMIGIGSLAERKAALVAVGSCGLEYRQELMLVAGMEMVPNDD